MNVLNQMIDEKYAIYNGDSCEVVKNIPDNSIHYTLFSPPFASLYTYSNSDRDMGNSKGDDEFYKHFEYLAKELYRITMPGRLLSFHCMDLPMMKERDGVIGLKDFPAIVRQVFQDCGFIYHSRVTIWKNPVTEMQRTKALGLLHKQIRKDSTMCRQGIPDYIITMRKPGENPERVSHTHETFPVDVWQNYASPVWMDIKQSDTLQKKSARAEKDERHICPLQLDVIQRCIELWTNPNDIVLDPFAGIGSVPYVALKLNRRGLGIELKQSYYEQAKANLASAAHGETMDNIVGQMTIWDFLPEDDQYKRYG
jgi:DNA modification methylase